MSRKERRKKVNSLRGSAAMFALSMCTCFVAAAAQWAYGYSRFAFVWTVCGIVMGVMAMWSVRQANRVDFRR